MKTKQREWMFLFVCIFLGILAELSFLHGEIGISYIIFIAVFYSVVFIRFRFSFEHRRIGLLLMAGIWILAGSYVLYDSTVFYLLNTLVIPAVVFFHIVLITSPGSLNWSKLSFIKLVSGKLLDTFNFLTNYLSYVGRTLSRNGKQGKNDTPRHILLGFIIAIPLLFIVIHLLMSADVAFKEFVQRLFFFELRMNIVEIGFRIGFILIMSLFFFCVFKVLGKRTNREIEMNQTNNIKIWPGTMAVTILVLLNAVYVLFLVIQFQYLFSGGLHEGFTYADYARQGFFELLLVTLINWTVLLVCMKHVKRESRSLNRTLQILYSILIGVSGALLLSAWQRLMLYEEMYGDTMERLLGHSFMMFLMVIFAYTLIRVWLENLPILHFYLISSFIFYALLNVVNLEETIVENNIERYEETGKIDLYYLNRLGGEGLKGLIYLYEQDPDIPELKEILAENQERFTRDETPSWQSFNFTRNEARSLLKELEL